MRIASNISIEAVPASGIGPLRVSSEFYAWLLIFTFDATEGHIDSVDALKDFLSGITVEMSYHGPSGQEATHHGVRLIDLVEKAAEDEGALQGAWDIDNGCLQQITIPIYVGVEGAVDLSHPQEKFELSLKGSIDYAGGSLDVEVLPSKILTNKVEKAVVKTINSGQSYDEFQLGMTRAISFDLSTIDKIELVDAGSGATITHTPTALKHLAAIGNDAVVLAMATDESNMAVYGLPSSTGHVYLDVSSDKIVRVYKPEGAEFRLTMYQHLQIKSVVDARRTIDNLVEAVEVERL